MGNQQQNESTANNSDDPQYVAKRFTLTEQHDDWLSDLADKHYGGNRSHCLRGAIEDHLQSFENTDEAGIKELLQTIKNLQDHIDDLKSEETETADDSETTDENGNITQQSRAPDSATKDAVHDAVLNVGQDGITLSGLFQQVSAEPLKIHLAAHALVNEELLTETTDDASLANNELPVYRPNNP